MGEAVAAFLDGDGDDIDFGKVQFEVLKEFVNEVVATAGFETDADAVVFEVGEGIDTGVAPGEEVEGALVEGDEGAEGIVTCGVVLDEGELAFAGGDALGILLAAVAGEDVDLDTGVVIVDEVGDGMGEREVGAAWLAGGEAEADALVGGENGERDEEDQEEAKGDGEGGVVSSASHG